jgi:hypothetical protein
MPKIGCSIEIPIDEEQPKVHRIRHKFVALVAIFSVVAMFFKLMK